MATVEPIETPTRLGVEWMIDKVSDECCKAPVVERILKQIYLYVGVFMPGFTTARATMIDLQRVRSMAMFASSASLVPSCLRYLQRTSPPSRARGSTGS